MNKLQMTKAFAELEGLEVAIMGDKVYLKSNAEEYNPFDYALNCKARDDYSVEICYKLNYVCGRDYHGYTEFECVEEIPVAVIDSILKSNGIEV